MFYFNAFGINLQMFAEGSDGGAGATAAAANAGVAAPQTETGVNPLADVIYGKQADVSDAGTQTQESAKTEPAAPDRKAEFEKLIKGDYKEEYGKRVEETVRSRIKPYQSKVDRYNELQPMLEMLAGKYGVKADDVEALNKAIAEDDAFYEKEAYEKGVSVEQLKAYKKMERENTALRRVNEERDAREQGAKQYAAWTQQAEAAKAVYPSLDLRTEVQSPDFIRLLRAGVDVRTAFEVLHKDEIIPAAMQYTAKAVEKQVTDKIAAMGARPAENGLGASGAAVVKSDVSKLTDADMDEIIRRVAGGERIVF